MVFFSILNPSGAEPLPNNGPRFVASIGWKVFDELLDIEWRDVVIVGSERKLQESDLLSFGR